MSMRTDVSIVCVGGGDIDAVEGLKAIGDTVINGQFVWIDSQDDMNSVYNGLDVVCLPSVFGEGFPNAVGEAMACGVPCVVTAAGDAADIVGETGRVVPKQNPKALAGAVHDTLETENGRPSHSCRHRIQSLYSVELLVERTTSCLKTLVGSAL